MVALATNIGAFDCRKPGFRCKRGHEQDAGGSQQHGDPEGREQATRPRHGEFEGGAVLRAPQDDEPADHEEQIDAEIAVPRDGSDRFERALGEFRRRRKARHVVIEGDRRGSDETQQIEFRESRNLACRFGHAFHVIAAGGRGGTRRGFNVAEVDRLHISPIPTPRIWLPGVAHGLSSRHLGVRPIVWNCRSRQPVSQCTRSTRGSGANDPRAAAPRPGRQRLCTSTVRSDSGTRRLSIIDLAAGASADRQRGRHVSGSSSTARSSTTSSCARARARATASATAVATPRCSSTSYEEYGDDFVEQLNGQFAIASGTARRRPVLAFAIGSASGRCSTRGPVDAPAVRLGDQGAVLAAARRGRRLDPECARVRPSASGRRWCRRPALFEGVLARSAPGHMLIVERRTRSIRRYWDWPFGGEARSTRRPRNAGRGAARAARSTRRDRAARRRAGRRLPERRARLVDHHRRSSAAARGAPLRTLLGDFRGRRVRRERPFQRRSSTTGTTTPRCCATQATSAPPSAHGRGTPKHRGAHRAGADDAPGRHVGRGLQGRPDRRGRRRGVRRLRPLQGSARSAASVARQPQSTVAPAAAQASVPDTSIQLTGRGAPPIARPSSAPPVSNRPIAHRWLRARGRAGASRGAPCNFFSADELRERHCCDGTRKKPRATLPPEHSQQWQPDSSGINTSRRNANVRLSAVFAG